jgi:hypothetical protein
VPAADAVVDRLRGDAARRPSVDPGLAGGLRAWLEDGVAGAAAARPAGSPPVVVGRRSLHDPGDAFGTGAGGAVPWASPGEVTVPLARAAMVGALFRQAVVTGRIANPVADALCALEVGGHDAAIVGYVRRLRSHDRAALYDEVATQAAILLARWPAIPPGWLPRTGDRLALPLAGGRIVLTGVVDLLLGAPSAGRASTCLVSLRTGERRSDDRNDAHHLALLETLRAGAPPFQVATYYSATGGLEVEDVPDAALAAAVQRTIEAVDRRCRAPAVTWQAGLAA